MTDSEFDRHASERAMVFYVGWFADPLVFGQYPALMVSSMPRNILPVFTDEESLLLKNSVDFYSINHYTSKYVQLNLNKHDEDYLGVLHHVFRDGKLIGEQAESDWLFVVPYGIRKSLEWIHRRYPDLPIIIRYDIFSHKVKMEFLLLKKEKCLLRVQLTIPFA